MFTSLYIMYMMSRTCDEHSNLKKKKKNSLITEKTLNSRT